MSRRKDSGDAGQTDDSAQADQEAAEAAADTAALPPSGTPPALEGAVVHHRKLGDDGHAVEVDGKWYPLTGDQPEKLSALEAQGVPVREACAQAGVTIDAPAAE